MPSNHALKLTSAAIDRAILQAACGRARTLTIIRYAAGRLGVHMNRSNPLFFALALVFALSREGASQAAYLPDTVIVRSGPLLLHALLWQPQGTGPFPAILVNHGSYLANESLQPDDPGALGPLFGRRGYVCLVLFRRGVGPSADQGPPEGELMGRALAEHGQTGRNRVQLELLEGEALNEALAGLGYLRGLPAVDPVRIAVVGHSFGGSLSILLAARDSTLRAAILFGAAAGSWDSSPELQGRLMAAVHEARASMFFIHASNDYSVASGKSLAAELQRIGKTHRLTIYPRFGSTTRAGHNLVFRSLNTWERDVFAFLKTHLSR